MKRDSGGQIKKSKDMTAWDSEIDSHHAVTDHMTIGENHREMRCIAVVTHNLVQMGYFPPSLTNQVQEICRRHMECIISEWV